MGIAVGDVIRGGEEHSILDEVGQGAQDEGHKQVHVDVVAGAVEPPGGEKAGPSGQGQERLGLRQARSSRSARGNPGPALSRSHSSL